MGAFWGFAGRMLRYRWILAGALLFAVLSAGSLGAGLVGISPVLSNIFSDGHDLPQIAGDLDARLGGRIPDQWIASLPRGRFTAVVVIVSGLGVLSIFGGLANFLHAYLSLTVVHRTVTNVRREMFNRVVRLPLRAVVSGGASDVVSRITNDTTALSSGLNAVISKAAAQLLKGVAAFVAAFLIDWRLALAATLIAPALYFIVRRLGKRIRRASRRALEGQAKLVAASMEAIQGLRVVKVHAAERYESGRFHRINKEVLRQQLRVRTARAMASPLIEVLAILVLGGLSLLAAKAIIDGKLDQSAFITTLMALGVAGASLKPMTGLVNDVHASAAGAQRIAELLGAPCEPGHDGTLPKLARHRRSIELDRVSFTYPGAREPALRDVSLRIAHGQTVAIVGPNGSGKTTMLALIPRLFDPDEGRGRVLIDSNDIRDYSVRSVRRQIGVVTQETVIFHGTIRANIAYGAENPTERRVVEAARQARADGFIRTLPQGYDTMVGEQGLTLSGGQRQRLAIARAVLRNPAILILDEATSMIDADSEARIAEAVADFSKGRTCLIVAHRLSTVAKADRIIVMDRGRIIDDGTHEQLLERCKTYQLIARTQLFHGSAGHAD